MRASPRKRRSQAPALSRQQSGHERLNLLRLAVPRAIVSSRTPATPTPRGIYILRYGAQKTMEPHSRPCSTSHNGTLRLPQALLLLLRSALAGSTTDRVTPSDSELPRWYSQSIKSATCHLIHLFNPFAISQGRWTLTFVGMIKLTALCGIGSVLWIWNKPSSREKALGFQPASDAAAGELFAQDWRKTADHVVQLM